MVVNLGSLPDFAPISGVKLASDAAGIRYHGRDDMVLFAFSEKTICAAVFTTNAFAAAPVQVAKKHLGNHPLYWLVNAGNANAATGEEGINDAICCCKYVAQHTQNSASQVLPFSTGVIGERLPMNSDNNLLSKSIPRLFKKLSDNSWHHAARAIMTTDTRPKGISVEVPYGNNSFTINGIIKGSGMIHPNMATMLAFIATDVDCSQELLQSMLASAVDESFHCISVDGDTSTNDAVAIAATGKSNIIIDTDISAQNLFQQHLSSVCCCLAQSVIRDAEGASRYVTIEVVQTKSQHEARKVAKTVALSPLVKTALFAGDPNWGRIICSIGYAGVDNLDPALVDISVNGINIVTSGTVAPNYNEEIGLKLFACSELHIVINLNRGKQKGHCITCDFGHEYITINAEYRS